MYEFSVEQSANSIDDHRTKEYFGEVMNNYFNGNYRSSIVMLWTVVICDLIYKLQYLRDIHEDKKAKSILDEIADFQANNPANPKWEENLLKEVKEKTNLLEGYEFDSLISLQKHRHLSAHPVINRTDILFRPHREMVLADMRAALDSVLTKPPILTKQVFDELAEDLEKVKELFPDYVQLKRYLESKYFRNLNDEVSKQIFKSLWRITFKSEDKRCDDNREVNGQALRVLFERNRESLSEYIRSNSPYFSEISSGSPLRQAIFFLGDYPHLYSSLSEAAREFIAANAHSDIDLFAVSYFLSKDVSSHIDSLIKYIEENHKHAFGAKNKIHPNHVNDLLRHASSAGIRKKVNSLMATMYINSANFDAADMIFSRFIKPNVMSFEAKDIELLIEGIGKNNQTYWRGRADSDHEMIIKRAQEVIEDFDSTRYSFLPDVD